jgi:HK97 family phage portal protein
VAQLIQEKTFSIDDIARILTIPPHLLQELSHATFSNIEEENTQFVEMTLRPICKRLEVELENKLFFTKDLGKYSVKFNLNGLLRGNTDARTKMYQSAIQNVEERGACRGRHGTATRSR